VYYNIGNTFLDQGKLDKAIGSYNTAVSIKPDYAEALYNMGNALRAKLLFDEAIKVYKKAIKIDTNYLDAHNNLGNSFLEQGKIDEARDSFKKVISINPDHESAKHMLSSLSGDTPKTAPKQYVESLFDGYAAKFENSLTGNLGYNIPELVTDLLVKLNRKKSLGSVLDLGCGTGLLGTEIKNYCSNLEGIDLSDRMLKIADQKQVYSSLSKIDIVEYLSSEKLNFDYFIALDVFIYVGDLYEIFRLIKSKNKKSGKLVFSTEHTEKDGYHLLQTGRYSHSKSYIESLCKEFGYEISHFAISDLRKERKVYLEGGIYMLEFAP
jgi:predicted TPR repeat methyltransferase